MARAWLSVPCAALLLSLHRLTAQQDYQDRLATPVARDLLQNVVQLDVSRSDGDRREEDSGFGFIVAQSGNRVFISTANHLIQGEEGSRSRWRTIDIDVVLFNRDVLRIGNRRIPDPEILERAFVAIPLGEIDPAYVHPEQGISLQQIARGLRSSAQALKLRPDVRLLGGA